jgi:hypothetical protein
VGDGGCSVGAGLRGLYVRCQFMALLYRVALYPLSHYAVSVIAMGKMDTFLLVLILASLDLGSASHHSFYIDVS